MNCPKCGAALALAETEDLCAEFDCGTYARSDGFLEESNDCIRLQRDALLARVKRMEKAGDRMRWVMSCNPMMMTVVDKFQAVQMWDDAKEEA